MQTNAARATGPVIVFSILFLFFLELITDFIAGIYSFGLLETKLPPEMIALILLLSPFLLIFFRKGLSNPALVVLGETILICRSVEVFLPIRFQLIVAAIGTGIFLILFPALLWRLGQNGNRRFANWMGGGLLVAVAVSILLRTLGRTMDLSNEQWYWALAWILAVIGAILMPGVLRLDTARSSSEVTAGEGAGWVKSISVGLGTASVFALLYFGFSSPAVIARWTGSNYLLILTAAVLGLVIFSWLLTLAWRNVQSMSAAIPFLLTAAFSIALTLTLYVNQPRLPGEPTGYPFLDPAIAPGWMIVILTMLFLFPMLIVDFNLLVQETILSRPTMRKIGLGFGLGSLLMMVLILAHVFTSTWAYIDPIIEPLFRNRFWQVYFAAGVVLTLSILVVSRDAVVASLRSINGSRIFRLAGAITIMGFITLTAAFLMEPDPEGSAPGESITIAGYNLRQGYDIAGQRGHHDQCEVLRELNADIIGLVETDTARVAGGNFDIVRFMAQCLNMYSYAGPKTATGTFGYALLSRYPISNAQTFHLYSNPGEASSNDPEKRSGGDQTAIIKGEVTVGTNRFKIFVIHNDSNPPIQQPEGLVSLTAGREQVIAVGDFNCSIGSTCFEIIAENLIHCADLSGGPELQPGDVDHIFVSPDQSCSHFSYIENDASDHPVVTAEIPVPGE